MSYWTTSLTTGSTLTSAAFNSNWRNNSPLTATVVSNSSTMTSDFTFQYTLDDVYLVGGSSNQSWLNYASSAIGVAGVHYTSSQTFPDGATISFLNPIAGLRMSSTAISSSTLTLKVLQVDHN